MRRSLSFRARTQCTSTGDLIDVLCLFLGRSPADFSLLNNEVQDALKQKEPLPDALYVLTYGSQGQEYARLLREMGRRTEVLLARGSSSTIRYLKDFAVLNLQVRGFERAYAIADREYAPELGKLLEAGVAHLVASTGGFQEAPTGHLFSHPSGRRTKYFLAASELLKNEVDAFFLGLCIVSSAQSELSQADALYIDTMGIYPVARAAQEIYEDIGSGSGLQLVSFHSHAGLKDCQPKNNDLVLISASTTGGMARTFVTAKGLPPSNVVTLLDITRKGRAGRTLYGHDEHASIDTSNGSLAGTETSIELAGEYFAARGKRPKALTLAVDHRPANLKELLDEFSASDRICLQSSRADGSGAVDMVSFTQEEVAKSAAFRRWAAEEVRLRTPSSVSHVLTLGGRASGLVGEFLADELQSVAGRRPQVVAETEIDRLQSERSTGVLICSAVVGNGHILRIAARDLRELVPSASRHFIIGCGLPDTYESWARLRQFLTQSGDSNRPYLFGCWRQLALGPKRPTDTWSRYAKLLQEMEHVPALDGPNASWTGTDVDSSIQIAMRSLEGNRGGLLPDMRGRPLQLTKGFVFWNPLGDLLVNAHHQAVSYLAMSSALQFAREHKDSSIRLRSSLHEAVLLDPENFLRFNDSVLQASLLRGANSYELDFSMSPELSQAMRDFLEKVFLNHSSPYGAAALEFAAALASRHLKLTSDDTDALTVSAISQLDRPSALCGLLYIAWLRVPRSPIPSS